MSTTAKNVIASELALLVQVADFPTSPFGYGSDISGDQDLSEDMSETNGFTTLALAQAIVRRIDCPRGALPDDKDYGIDIRSYCNRGVTADEIRSMGGQIRNETLKDDRVDSVLVVVSPSPTGKSITIEMQVAPFDSTIGNFSLTLSASSAEILIEEIRAAA